MKHIGDKLTHHKDTLLAASEDLRIIARLIGTHSGITIDEKQIRIQGRAIYLTLSALKRQKIMIYKKVILENQELKNKYINIY